MTFTPRLISSDTVTPTPTLDLRLRPGAVLPSGRLRTGLVATARVVSGSVAFAVKGEDLDAEPGTEVTLEPHDDPAIWNTGDDVAHLRVGLRIPPDLVHDDLTETLIAVESLVGFGSVRDVTGRAGDAPMREALERELGDLAELVRAQRLSPAQFLAAA